MEDRHLVLSALNHGYKYSSLIAHYRPSTNVLLTQKKKGEIASAQERSLWIGGGLKYAQTGLYLCNMSTADCNQSASNNHQI